MSYIYEFPMSLLILVPLVVNVAGERDFNVFLDYGSCTHNPVFVKSSNCSVDTTFDPPRAYFDIQMQREIQSMFFRVQLTFQYQKSIRKFMNTKSQNLCDFMEGKSLAFLFLNVRKLVKKYGELPERCPVNKDFRFLFKDLVADSEYFPVFTPKGNFSLRVTINCGKEFCFKFEYRGSIRRK